MSIWEKMGFGGYKGFSHEADRLLRSAVELAGNLGCEKADTSHLLLAILQQDQGAAARFLTGKQICEPEVRRQLAQTRRAPALHLARACLPLMPFFAFPPHLFVGIRCNLLRSAAVFQRMP